MDLKSSDGDLYSSPPTFGNLCFNLEIFYSTKVRQRKIKIFQSIQLVINTMKKILQQVELNEPRFVGAFAQCDNGYLDSLRVLSNKEFEFIIYLGQMGVFNLVDEQSNPGTVSLKLCDGKKRTMSLWVEFITASGYLSSRKLRSKFHSLITQSVEKCKDQSVKMSSTLFSNKSIRLLINDKYLVNITLAFKCLNSWPRCSWPSHSNYRQTSYSDMNNYSTHIHSSIDKWPYEALVRETKNQGFDLLSKEHAYYKKKTQQFNNLKVNSNSNNYTKDISLMTNQSNLSILDRSYNNNNNNNNNLTKVQSDDHDTWLLTFERAENNLLRGGCRKKCLSILKTLKDRHFDSLGSPIDLIFIKTLLLYECEKHSMSEEWKDNCMGDRVIGILLQMISCLQNKSCLHYFIQEIDLLKGQSASSLDCAAKQAWIIIRDLITNFKNLENL